MAERLDINLPLRVAHRYPWDQWLDGATWRLDRTSDFAVSDHWLVAVARRVAADRGLHVRTSRCRGDGLYIQAVPADPQTAHSDPVHLQSVPAERQAI